MNPGVIKPGYLLFFVCLLLVSGCSVSGRFGKPVTPDALLDQGLYNQAVESYLQMLSRDPEDTNAIRGLALSYFGTKNYREAVHHLKLWLQIEPQSFEAHHLLGIAIARTGENLDEAINQLQQAAELNSNGKSSELASIYYALLLAYCQKGQIPECVAAYQKMNTFSSGKGMEQFSEEGDYKLLSGAYDQYLNNKHIALDLDFSRPTKLNTPLPENLVVNPSFEEGTGGWLAYGGEISRTTERSRIGKASIIVEAQSEDHLGRVSYDASQVITDTRQYTWSVWVYPLSASDTIRLFFYDDVSPGSVPAAQDFPVPADTWTRLQVNGAFGAGAKLRHLSAMSLNQKAFYLDAAQLEPGDIATPYCDGSQPGCTWSVEPNNSASITKEDISRVTARTGQDVKLSGRFQKVPGPWENTSALVQDATINLVVNPSFEEGTGGWLAYGGEISRTTERSRIGKASIIVEAQSEDHLGRVSYDASQVITDTRQYTWSVWVYPLSASDTIRLFFYDDVSPGSVPAAQDFPVPADTWTRLQVNGAFGAGAKLRHLSAMSLNQKAFYLDAAQLEPGDIATPYCDGSQPGCTWSVEPNNSASTSFGGVSFKCPGNFSAGQQTILVWLLPRNIPQTFVPIWISSWQGKRRISLLLNSGTEQAGEMAVIKDDESVSVISNLGTPLDSNMEWQLIGYSFDGKNQLQGFFDDRVNMNTIANWPLKGSMENQCNIGYGPDEQNLFAGIIGRVMVFGSSLNAHEVSEIYQMGLITGRLPPNKAPVP